MTASELESLLKRDRLIAVFVLLVITVLAWVYTLRLASGMEMSGGAMDSMPDMPGMADMIAPAFREWSLGDFALMFVMWVVMMAGMMTPSASPMILIYARVARQAASSGKPLAATGWFASGYLLSWAAFSVVAVSAQWLFERAAWLTPMMESASNRFGGIVLIAAGIYQWTPLKDSCLAQCRSPLSFIQDHGGFKKNAAGSLALGLRHGLYCVGCCWALMALLFVVGVMNVLWIAGLAALVLIEKVFPGGRIIARVAGAVIAAAGLWLLATAS